ncbi:MAG: hypothetical protein DCF31_11315 [Alphaproteobacteria bacterium]|nr:MAG: hypothetical protein DCF31_11315 [Alphaproteobacteria bacterium]
MHSPILAPVVALVAWTLVMLVWAIAVRIPEFGKAGIDINSVRGGKPGGLDGILPDQAQWKMHNYIHLTEQPVLFYAICGVLAVTGTGGGFNAILAWSYVGLRVVHSFVQSTSNIIKLRFALFALSTLALMALTLHAALALAWH